MKRLASFFFVLFFFVSFNAYAQDALMDIAPTTTFQADTIPPAGFPYPKLFTFYYGSTPGPNGGTVGAMYFQNRYYLNRWNSTMLYRYNGGIGGFTTLADSAAYQGAIRDLTTDGTFLYGAPASATLHRMNANGISQGTITLAGGVGRAIAYSPDESVFFACDFGTNITVHNKTTGALVRTLTGTSTIAGKYGMGYSNYDGPKLWVWAQGTGVANILQVVNPTTGATIAGPYTFNLVGGLGIAGGAEVCVIGGYYVLLLNWQNFAVQGYQLAAVPVELTSFTANTIGQSVNLNWSTASETNNSGFEVERSAAGSEFATVGFIAGKGTTSEAQEYSFIDNVSNGTYTYRLKQVDYNGSFEYSEEVEVVVSAPSVFALNQNYPNPFNPSTTINFSLAVDSKVSVKVFDLLGQEVSSLVNSTLPAGLHNVNFDASSLNSGVYFYQIEASGVDGTNFSSVKKMMLTK